jgi:hypothetical protein
MAQNRESQAERIRRAKQEFDGLANSTLLSEPEAAAVNNESPPTWKDRRLSRSDKGATPVYLNGQVKYTVGEIRAWRQRRIRTDNQEYHEGRRRGREEKARKANAEAAARS